MINIFEEKLAGKIIPYQILPHLTNKENGVLISEEECDEIRKEEQYRGEKSATFMLLTCLPKRHPQWYPKFMEILFLNGWDETVQEVDYDEWKSEYEFDRLWSSNITIISRPI